MSAAILGKKVGMTRMYLEDGTQVPVTVIQAGPCVVTEIKTQESHGYSAIQIGFEDVKPERSTQPIIGHDAKAGTGPKRFHREIRLDDDSSEASLGDTITVETFNETAFVDIVATSKGKGFAGVMKRHHFRGLEASHGTERKHRSAGSISGHGTNRGTGPKLKRGKRMAGHMGDVRVTVRNLDVVRVLPEKNILIVKGTVPGPNGGLLYVRTSKRLGRAKQGTLKAKKK